MEIVKIKVVPAIYQLNGNSNWGWHNVKELAQIINNLFKLQDYKTILGPKELVKSFQAITLDGHLPVGLYPTYQGNFKFFRDCHCLHNFTYDSYVAAGWGMDVIKAAKLGAIKVFRKEKNQCELWGKKEDDSRFTIKL